VLYINKIDTIFWVGVLIKTCQDCQYFD